MEDILVKIGSLLLSLSILITVHEFGHFLFARLFKTRVNKFYLFFDFLFPMQNVLNFALFKFKKGDTEYGLGWFPLGGYVQIDGMVDESMDTEKLNEEPKPWEFRSKKAWQRLLIMAGGVIFNLVAAVIIYTALLFAWGESYLATQDAKYGIAVGSLGEEIGLQDGDQILSVDGNKVEVFSDLTAEVIFREADYIEVERNGQEKKIEIPEGFIGKLIKDKRQNFIFPRRPFEVEEIAEGRPAEAMGLQKGDKFIAVAGESVSWYHDFKKALLANKGKETDFAVLRGTDTLQMAATVGEDGTLGFVLDPMDKYFHISVKEYSFFAAIPAGFVKTYETIGSYLAQLRLLFTSSEVKVNESLGGFGTIGSLFPGADTWSWLSFWSLTAFLSIILAVANLLPIPALDGGHIMFIFYEMVSGRKPSIKFLEYAQVVGMIILFGLMIYANGLDIIRAFK